MQVENLSPADLKAMQHQLMEEKSLYEASGQTDKAYEAAQQAARITEELRNRMHDTGVMLRS